LAAASPTRLYRCLMAAVFLRQAVSMPHGRRLSGVCCVVAFGRSQFGAGCLVLKALSEPMDIVSIRSHAFKCTSLGVSTKEGVPAEKRKVLGYHASSAGEVVPCYSRNEIADPLNALGGVRKMVRDCASFHYADRLCLLAATPEQVRQCRDRDVAADDDVAYGDEMRKPYPYVGDVATPREVPEDVPVLDGSCGFCDEARYLALGWCFRCRGESLSRAWKSESAMAMRALKWLWHAVAIPPLEMYRRVVRWVAGLIVDGSATDWSKDSDGCLILIAECPAFRRDQNLVKNRAMLMRIGITDKDDPGLRQRGMWMARFAELSKKQDSSERERSR
jgi:hypothetical protein